MKLGTEYLDCTSSKVKALVGMLVLTPGRTVSREQAAGQLWSNVDDGNARQSLRQALADLRRILGQRKNDLLFANHDDLRLGAVASDVDDLLRELEGGSVPALLLQQQLLTEQLMLGFEDVDPLFRGWLVAKQQSLLRRITDTLERRLREGNAADGADRERVALALLNLDPMREEAVRVLMTCRAGAGDIAGALRIYTTLRDHLAIEFESQPAQQTKDLDLQIRRAQSLQGEKPPQDAVEGAGLDQSSKRLRHGLRLQTRLVVSVGTFDVTAVDVGQQRKVKQFRQQLISSLARFREWIIRDQSVEEEGGAPAGDQVGDYTVQVSGFNADKGVQLSLTLQEVATGTCLWGEEVVVSKARWVSAQRDIVRWLAMCLNINLSVKRLSAIGTRAKADLTANDLWLLGQSKFLSFDAAHWNTAKTLLKQAIAQAPNFAPAYSSLAQINNTRHMVMPGVFRDRRRIEEGLVWAGEAARLDPVDSRSQLCLAWSLAMAGQYDQAVQCADLANRLNENDAWTMVSSAGCLAVCGDYPRGQVIAARAIALPLTPTALQWAYHVSIRFMGGDYAGAVEAATSAGEFSYVPGYKAAALWHAGERATGRAELERWMRGVRSRWAGPTEPSDENIMRWLLSMIPIRRVQDWERVREGLAGIGAPVGRLRHNSL